MIVPVPGPASDQSTLTDGLESDPGEVDGVFNVIAVGISGAVVSITKSDCCARAFALARAGNAVSNGFPRRS